MLELEMTIQKLDAFAQMLKGRHPSETEVVALSGSDIASVLKGLYLLHAIRKASA